MLAAEKQVLDANLRNNLQDLRRMELKMVVNRFQTVSEIHHDSNRSDLPMLSLRDPHVCSPSLNADRRVYLHRGCGA